MSFHTELVRIRFIACRGIFQNSCEYEDLQWFLYFLAYKTDTKNDHECHSSYICIYIGVYDACFEVRSCFFDLVFLLKDRIGF